MAAPSRSVLPQPAQVYSAVVTSKEKTSSRGPAAALPSSLSASIALYPPVAPKRSVFTRATSWPRPTSAAPTASTSGVGPHTKARGRSSGRQRTVPCREGLQFPAVDDLLVGARGVEQACGHVTADGSMVTEHRHQRHHARTSADQEEGAAFL